jgi:hypothetical protein
MTTLAHVLNGELGSSARAKLNALIAQYNATAGIGVSNLLLEGSATGLAGIVGVVPSSYRMIYDTAFDPSAIEYLDASAKTAWNTGIPSFPLDWPSGTPSSSVTMNTVVAPDGATTGSSWVENSANSVHMIRSYPVKISQVGSPVRCGFIAKANTRTRIVARMAAVTSGGSSETASSVGFDLAGGNVGYDVVTGTGWTVSNTIMTSLASGWFLCTFDAYVTGTAYEYWYLTFYLDNGSGTAARSISYTGNGTSGVSVWWANMLPKAMWGMTQTFVDDFASSSTFDLANTRAAGFNWYLANSWSACPMTGFDFNSHPATVAAGLSVSGSVLTWTDATTTTTNYIYTATPKVGDATQSVGQSFAGPALFETKATWGSEPTAATCWPAFWADPVEALTGHATSFVELDFMEHYDVNNSRITTWGIHVWTAPTTHTASTGSTGRTLVSQPGYNLSNMNLYSSLWLPAATNNGTGVFMNFFNGIVVTDGAMTWTTSDPYAVSDTHHMIVILSGGNSAASPFTWVTYYDWVKVFQ